MESTQLGARVVLVLLAVLSLAAGGEARAADSPGPTRPGQELPGPTGPPSEDPETDAAPEDDAEKPSFRWTRFRLHGRAIGDWTSVSQGDTSESELNLDNARLSLNWRPARWLRGQLEYDVAANRKLKDAYLQGRTDALSLRVGQFKPPFSVVAMDSRWELPVSRRGQLDEVLAIMGIIGRRPGVQVGYQPRGGDIHILAGVFQASSVYGNIIGKKSFDDSVDDWTKVTARAQLERRRLRLGVSGDWRPAEPLRGVGVRLWTLDIDAAWRQPRKEGGWRLWAEGFVGSSWQDFAPGDGVLATFLAGQVIASWRRGGHRAGGFYVEPYTLLSVLDPDSGIRNDAMWEAAGGVNVGRWEQLRVTVEVQHRSVGVNVPSSLGRVLVEDTPYTQNRIVLQLGGAF